MRVAAASAADGGSERCGKAQKSLVLVFGSVAAAAEQLSGDLRIREIPVQKQDGIHDCGVFAVAFSVEVCQNSNLCRAHFEQSMMRLHLIDCLSKQFFKSGTSEE